MTRAKPIRIIGRAGDSDSVGVASPLPLSLYVHLPWCLSKCPYCDFNSHEWRRRDAAIPEQRYLDALKADLEASLPLIWGRSIQSIFIGGGTPSLFSPAAIEQLLDMIRARVRLVADAEISLEANPGTFEAQRFAAYAKAGVNRLSIGVQSFSDDALRTIGRVHDADQARAAVEEAASVFRTFNVDLMYALPGQSLDALRADITEAIDRGAPHLSCYHLTLEPGTPFAKRPPVLPDEDVAAEMQASIDAACAEAGLARYEISAFAKAGHRCRHNLNYWEFGDYLGIGAGAHGKLSFSSRIVRQSRVRQPDRYMDALCAADSAAIVATPDRSERAPPVAARHSGSDAETTCAKKTARPFTPLPSPAARPRRARPPRRLPRPG